MKDRNMYINHLPRSRSKNCEICAKEFLAKTASSKYCLECKKDMNKKPKMK